MKGSVDKYFVFILLAGLAVFGANIWGLSVYMLDEAKNASCAAEMLQRGDWVVPTFNGELRTDKPPFHYYLMMLAFTLGGVNPLTARIFQSLAGVFLMGYVYQYVKRKAGVKTAIITALVLCSSFQLHVQFHLAVPDPFLIIWLTVTLLSFYDFYEGNTKAWKWIFIGAGFGFLTKGPVAVVLPAGAAIIFLFLTSNLSLAFIRRMKLLQGIALFLLVAMPWYVAVGLKTDGAWLEGFFLQHNIGRFTDTMEGHRGYFILPPVVLLLSLFPFSLFAFAAIRQAWREKGLSLFATCVVFTITLFFMLSKTFLPGYISPAIPFLSIVLGNYLSEHFQWSRSWMWTVPVAVLFGLLITGALLFGLKEEGSEFSGLHNLNLLTLILPVALGVAGYFLSSKNLQAAFISTVTGWIAFSLVVFYFIAPVIDRNNPVRMSENIRRLYHDYTPVAYGLFNPAFVFEYKSVIPRFNDVKSLRKYIEEHPRSLILARSSAVDEIRAAGEFKVVFQQRDLFEKSETVILVPLLNPESR
ncbi:MAG: glycosyltransferase family 39 protein [Cyclobacteriaceae bacterium]|nr:glycosyltransferase family 39 protein [Cyclobacteriaceae bacterium]